MVIDESLDCARLVIVWTVNLEALAIRKITEAEHPDGYCAVQRYEEASNSKRDTKGREHDSLPNT
jgi:hypothetical protein